MFLKYALLLSVLFPIFCFSQDLKATIPTKTSIQAELTREQKKLFGFRHQNTVVRGQVSLSAEEVASTMNLYTKKGVWLEVTRGLGKLSEGYLMTLALVKLAKLIPGAPADASKALKFSSFLARGIGNYVSGIPVVNGAFDFFTGTQQLKKDFSDPEKLNLMLEVEARKLTTQKISFNSLTGKKLYYTLKVQLSAFDQLEKTLSSVANKKLSEIEKKNNNLGFFKKWILLENSHYEVEYLRTLLEYQISKNAFLEVKGAFVLNATKLLKSKTP